ncbi:MAG: MBOAT family protein [Defluviitaleaceae bacterium]|nr:MBOAT family protein [Defluviitaleaceae bacterium]
MIFNSFQFIVFFIAVIFMHYLLPHKLRWILILCASLTFYAAWNPLFLILLIFSVSVDYFLALAIYDSENKRKRKQFLALDLFVAFGVLFVFKYLLFFSNMAVAFLNALGLNLSPPEFSIILPLGISFYTFQAAGYLIDVYKGKQEPQRNYFKFMLFITFFPPLVAGPIERAASLMPQLFSYKKFNLDNIIEGYKFMCFGFFKKVVIADRIGAAVNTVYGAPLNFDGLALIIATFLFALQIYCDFSGYSDIAVGCGKMLGIDLTQNFKQPYLARGTKAFWRRWHISLSTWFKDYLYFPLGGSRVGSLRHAFNTMVTFVVSGLWHGANWTFLIWGGLHGIYQVAGNLMPKSVKLPNLFIVKFVQTSATFLLVGFAWIFFRANSTADAFYIAGNLFLGHENWFSSQYVFAVLNSMGMSLFELLIGLGCILFLFISELFCGEECLHETLMKKPADLRFAYYLLVTVLILALGVFYNAAEFIYFQF